MRTNFPKSSFNEPLAGPSRRSPLWVAPLLALPLGLLIALSLGVKTGMLLPGGAANFQAARLAPIIVLVLFGLCLVMVEGRAIVAASSFAFEQRRVRGGSLHAKAGAGLAGLLVAVLTVAIALLIQPGLAAVAGLPFGLCLLLGALVSLPFTVHMVMRGAVRGSRPGE